MLERIKNPKRFVAICAVVGVVGGIGLAALLSALFPVIARDKIESRLAGVEKRYDVDIEISDIVRQGISGAELRDLTVKDNQTDRVLVKAKSAGASVSVVALLSQEIVLTELWADQLDITVTETEDGGFDVLKIPSRGRNNSESAEPTEPAEEAKPDRMSSILGGTLPELSVTDINVRFVTRTDAWPIDSLSIPEATIVSGDPFQIDAVVNVLARESDIWQLPTNTEVHVKVDGETLQPVGGAITFDQDVRITKFGPLPFVIAGFSGVSFDEMSNVNVQNVVLDLGEVADPPFFAADSLSVSLLNWTPKIRDIRINRMAAVNPILNDHIDVQGRSKMYDIRHMIRPAAPSDVRMKAIRIADKIKYRRDRDKDKGDREQATDPTVTPIPTDADPTVERPNLIEKIAEYLPRKVDIENAGLRVRDDREVDLPNWAKELQAKNFNFKLDNAVDSKRFNIDLNFAAMADDESRGSVKTELGWSYESQKLEASVEVDSLDLLWFSQLAGPAVADRIRGGKVRASIDVKPHEGRAVKLKGIVALNDLNVFHEELAEEPISEFNASYTFAAKYDPTGKIPTAKFLKHPTLPESVPPASAYRRGSFEVTAGTAEINGVKLSIRPEIYGTAVLPRLPARVDLDVKLEETKVQKLFDAVPTAIKGPLDGARFKGTFKWGLTVEVPLLHAKDMVWFSKPVLDEFEIVKLPHQVDVRRVARDMKITIKDKIKERGKEKDWQKRIYISTYAPVSTDWIVENMNLSYEELAAVREEHPKPPNLGQLTSSPAGTDGHAYMRLTSISPFLTRAILTTEDKGFWRHPGINFYAMRESLAQNIRAGGIKRGGSTIAMQLVKNLFLDRKKLYSRKLRETFLVYLMINQVNVPRERLLEVYFNVIEFAPRVYGIHHAAQHYFGKKPIDLTLGEVAFLVSIIPGPKRYHFMWERGKIPDYWFRKMSRYINAMYNNESITEEERDEAKIAAPEFWKPGPEGPPYRPVEALIPILPLDDGGDEDRDAPVLPFDF